MGSGGTFFYDLLHRLYLSFIHCIDYDEQYQPNNDYDKDVFVFI